MPSLRQQWDATKAAWDDDTSNASPGARFGLMFDPLAYIFGDKYRKEITKHGDKANLELSKLLGTDDRGGWAANKPASTLGLMAAAYYGGGALMGGGGAGGSAGGSGQGLGLFSNGGQGGLQGLGGGNAGALAQSGGIGGGAGMGAAGTGAGPAQLGMGGGGWQQQLQSMMGQGGFGSMPGMSTGVPPQQQATPPPQPMGAPNNIQAQPIDQTQLNKGMPAGVKLSRGLGSLRDALTPIDPRMAEGMDPNHVKALRNQAMLRMGLGMMANANQGGRFGEALAAGLGAGVGGFNRDIEGTYQRGVEAREMKRDEDRLAVQDKRYDAQIARQEARDELEDKRFEIQRNDRLTYQQKQLALDEAQLEFAKKKAAQEGNTPNYRDIDRLRAEYNKRAQKVQDSGNFAEQITMLANNPEIATDPSAQTALVFAFGKMLDPESVVREAEYKILEQSRGLQEQLQALLPRIQTGARLTPEQIQRMKDVAAQFAGKNRERIEALNGYYGELSKRRNIDPFEVTGQSGSIGGGADADPLGIRGN